MLQRVKELGDSIGREQSVDLKRILGENLYNLLDFALDSETEDDARKRIDTFVSVIKGSPLKIFKARKVLTDRQREIIMEFLGE